MSVKHNNKLRGLSIAALLLGSGKAMADYSYNIPTPVTDVGREIFSLHMLVFWVCVVIAVLVFGAMFISLLKHRKSKGAVSADFHENTTVEIIWTVVPMIILVAIAIPATKTLIKIEDHSEAEMTVKITGHQWYWNYEYKGTGVKYDSTLSTAHAKASGMFRKDRDGTRKNGVAKISNYLQEVNKGQELVLPVDTKIRLLTTAKNVIHSWWVPAFAVKRDAIPGVVNASWVKIDKDAAGKTFRGECAELCGKDHAFMPVVVKVMTKENFKIWLAKKKAAAEAEAAAAASNKTWTKAELMARGKGIYAAKCSFCHGANGEGVGSFPALKGSKIATGPASGHIGIVLKGGTRGMPSFKDMNDLDIAAVVTFERNGLGNNTGDIVQPAQVKAAR